MCQEEIIMELKAIIAIGLVLFIVFILSVLQYAFSMSKSRFFMLYIWKVENRCDILCSSTVHCTKK